MIVACPSLDHHNMRNPIKKKMQGGITHVMIVACPSLAFAFMLLLFLMPSSLFFLHLVPFLAYEMFFYTCFTYFPLLQ